MCRQKSRIEIEPEEIWKQGNQPLRVKTRSLVRYWEVRESGNGKIKITNQFAADPGGKIPAFIINLKTVQNPIKSILAIEKLIKLPKYQGRTLSIN